MLKILVTGSNGQLGSELRKFSVLHTEYNWIFTDRQELDLLDLKNLAPKISRLNPDVVINCAAYTDVDKAESEKELADIINNQAVAIMANWTFVNRSRFIHISTDYVFDGTSNIPLDENASTIPVNVYGKTKLEGERACLYENPESIIIRTSWVYSSYGSNFVKTISRLMIERDVVNIVNDQIGSPTYAADLAQVILDILSKNSWHSGIYNYSNEGELSWYEFALVIRDLGDFNCAIKGISSEQYQTLARRPSFSLLDKGKIKSTFSIRIPAYEKSLESCMKLIDLERI